MRYTKLSFEGLVEEFNNPDLTADWKRLHLHDIGNILMEGGPEARKAEAFLRDLLDSDKPNEDKLIVLRYLLALDYIEGETWQKLKKFPKESYENRRIFKQASEPVTLIRAGGV